MRLSIMHVVPTAHTNPLLLATLDPGLADYVVLSMSGESPLKESLNSIDVPLVTLNKGSETTPSVSALATAIRSFSPDVVEFHSLPSGVMAMKVMPLLSRRPRFISVRHHNLNHHLVPSRKARLIDRVIARLVDHNIAVSNAVRDTMIAEGIRAERITVVPNALHFPTLGESERVTLTPGHFDLLAVGRLDWQKDYETMLAVIAGLPSELRERVSLKVAGTGPDAVAEKLCALSQDLGLSETVNWLGYRQDVDELMRGADVLLHTARDEAFGLVLLEALQRGLPIVATGVGGAREVLAGYYETSPAGDVKALIEGLQATLNDFQGVSSKAAAYQSSVQARFSVSAQVQGHLDVCGGLV